MTDFIIHHLNPTLNSWVPVPNLWYNSAYCKYRSSVTDCSLQLPHNVSFPQFRSLALSHPRLYRYHHHLRYLQTSETVVSQLLLQSRPSLHLSTSSSQVLDNTWTVAEQEREYWPGVLCWQLLSPQRLLATRPSGHDAPKMAHLRKWRRRSILEALVLQTWHLLHWRAPVPPRLLQYCSLSKP